MQIHGLSPDGSHIRIDRFEGGVALERSEPQDSTMNLLVVDVETTGLDPHDDAILEFAAAHVACTQDGRVTRHHGTYGWLDDPGVPISPVITAITGLTDQDVRGHKIPDHEVERLFRDADLVVSHNAAFDWSFCRPRWRDVVDGKVWACSLTQIDWSAFPAAKQDVLARYHGFFYDAHRAAIDVEALVKLLSMRPTPQAPRYLQRLLRYSETTRYRVLAYGTPYAAKDDLKGRGYRWDGERRVWWTTCRDEALDDEQQWLDTLYRQHRCRDVPIIQRIDPAQQWA